MYVESTTVSSKFYSVEAPKVEVVVPTRPVTPSIHTQLSFSASATSFEDEVESSSFFSLLFGIAIAFSIVNHKLAFEFMVPVLKLVSSLPILGDWVKKIIPKEKSYGTGVGG